MVGDWKDEVCDPRVTTGLLRDGGSDGSSFRILMMFDRFAGAAFGGSTAVWGGLEVGRGGSLGMVKRLGTRGSVGE
jgi:hypothetical protein